MPFGLSRRKPNYVAVSMSEKYRCMILRLNIDCNACCRKLRRIVLRMKGIETHMIEKQQRKIYVCGRFVPSDVAIKIRKKMNRRVEILEVQEFGSETNEGEQTDQTENPLRTENAPIPMVVYPGQVPSFQPATPMAYCKGGYSTMEIAEVWGNCDCKYATEGEDELPCEEIRGIEVPSWENYLDGY